MDRYFKIEIDLIEKLKASTINNALFDSCNWSEKDVETLITIGNFIKREIQNTRRK